MEHAAAVDLTSSNRRLALPDGAREIVSELAAQEILRQSIHKKATSQDVAAIAALVVEYPGVCHTKLEFNLNGTKEEHLFPLQAVLHIKPSLDVVRKIYHANPSALYTTKPGSELSCLGIACFYGASFEVIQFLTCQHNDKIGFVCQGDANQSTPLHHACRFGQSFQVIEFLVSINPCVLQVRDRGGWTPVEVAAFHQKSPHVMKLFLDHVSEENEPSDATALQVAAYTNTVEVIQLLVDKFPWMLMRPHLETGFLPLHFACKRTDASIPVLQALIERNRNALSTMDRSGRLPLTVAHHSNPLSPVTHYLRQETVRVHA